jgi:hypothetical protein
MRVFASQKRANGHLERVLGQKWLKTLIEYAYIVLVVLQGGLSRAAFFIEGQRP